LMCALEHCGRSLYVLAPGHQVRARTGQPQCDPAGPFSTSIRPAASMAHQRGTPRASERCKDSERPGAGEPRARRNRWRRSPARPVTRQCAFSLYSRVICSPWWPSVRYDIIARRGWPASPCSSTPRKPTSLAPSPRLGTPRSMTRSVSSPPPRRTSRASGKRITPLCSARQTVRSTRMAT
jgi:hypothetical protein